MNNKPCMQPYCKNLCLRDSDYCSVCSSKIDMGKRLLDNLNKEEGRMKKRKIKQESNMLKRWRMFRGMRVIDLAELTGIPESRIHRAEQDRIDLSDFELSTLAKALGTYSMEIQEETSTCSSDYLEHLAKITQRREDERDDK